MKRREKRMKEKLAKKSKVGEEDVAASSIVDGLFLNCMFYSIINRKRKPCE